MFTANVNIKYIRYNEISLFPLYYTVFYKFL
jgi:hypothetical protein